MFALAGDLLRYVPVDVQGPHLVIPDRCMQSGPARRGWLAAAIGSGLDLHGGPDAIGPLAS